MNINNGIAQGDEGVEKIIEIDKYNISNTSSDIFNILSNSQEKYIFLSDKLTNIFNTKYLLALRNDIIKFYKGVIQNAERLGVELFDKEKIDEEEWLLRQSLNYKFVVDVFRENAVSKINIGIKSYSESEDELLNTLDFEQIIYLGRNEEQNHSYYLDNYISRKDWTYLVMQIFNEHGILIVDREEFWEKEAF